jgi:protein-disulfide isomerase
VRSNRRRRRGQQQEDSGSGDGSAPQRRASNKPAWRETLDSWGGFTVVGSVVGAVVFIIALIVINLPGSGVGGGEYTPIERSQVSGRIEGNPSAPVSIVAFEDFQCPFCKLFTDNIAPRILEDFVETGVANVTFRHFVVVGEESYDAAEAAECALDQDRFWDYHDLLYLRQGGENVGVFSISNLKKFARELQVEFPEFDVDEFDNCLNSGRKRSVVEEMVAEASSLGIGSTPSFRINGLPFDNTSDYETFRAAIQAAADAAGS